MVGRQIVLNLKNDPARFADDRCDRIDIAGLLDYLGYLVHPVRGNDAIDVMMR
jgi:hypothetical protein